MCISIAARSDFELQNQGKKSFFYYENRIRCKITPEMINGPKILYKVADQG